MSLFRKITVMALLGGLGATGGAFVGENLFKLEPPTRSDPRKVCLLFDVSRSMEQAIARSEGHGLISQLQALQDAATTFVDRQDLRLDEMGLIAFAWDARILTNLTQDANSLNGAINSLRAGGGTNLGLGLDRALELLKDEEGERWILLFTDGKPESSSTHEKPEEAALSAAVRARLAGIRIVAIGTPLADAGLLVQATGSPENVIIADPQKLHDAFRRSEAVINQQMLATAGNAESIQRNVALTGLWAALIAIGAGIGLVMGQNRHLRRRLLKVKEVLGIVLGGVVTGLLAGAASQGLFHVLSETSAVMLIGRVIAWALLGLGIGYGMGFFMPNLRRKRAAIAGAAGGVIAAFAFLNLVPTSGDTVGRLVAAAILGICTGLTTVLVEVVNRKAWLVVRWSEKESSSLALGTSPIIVGSSSTAHVLLPDSESPVPIMAKITMSEGVVGLEDGQSGQLRVLSDGETLQYGRIAIDVCASGAAEGAATPETQRPSRATDRRPKPPAPQPPAAKPAAPAAPKPAQKAATGGAKWYESDG
jgi:Ca-activated chloride channel family protein